MYSNDCVISGKMPYKTVSTQNDLDILSPGLNT